jgi:hypothetical protein
MPILKNLSINLKLDREDTMRRDQTQNDALEGLASLQGSMSDIRSDVKEIHHGFAANPVP